MKTSKSTRKKPKPREKKVDPNNPLTLPTPWEGIQGDALEDYAGFVYLITNLVNDKKYIGRKFLWKTSRVKVAGRKNRRRKVSASDWTHYKSSCDELKEDIKKQGLDSFRFEVLRLCRTRREVTYGELEEQVMRDVLHKRTPDGEYEYYNGLISAKVYRERTKEDG